MERDRRDSGVLFLSAAGVVLVVAAVSTAAETARYGPIPVPDRQTLMLLHVDKAKDNFVDSTGAFKPAVAGGSIVDDETWGKCLRLGGGDKNVITVPDGGKMAFTGGFTIEMWVRFDDPMPAKGASVALKIGSFCWSLTKEAKLNCSWMVFPTDPIFTTTETQYKYYPVGSDMYNGLAAVPQGKWVCLAMTYDQERSIVASWIDGIPDRLRYRTRPQQPLQIEAKHPLLLLHGFRNCSVGAVRVSSGPRPVGPTPAMEVYVNQLPYEGKVLLTFDHMDPGLSYPVEATVVWEKPSGESTTVQRVTFTAPEKRDVTLDCPTWKGSLHTIVVSATSAGRMVFTRTVRVANPKPSGTVGINADHSVSVNGKKSFPLMAYHALPEDFPLLAELGFNIVTNGRNLRIKQGALGKAGDPDFMTNAVKESLKAAQASNLLLMVNANTTFGNIKIVPLVKDDPALFGWYGFDEPWGDLNKLWESYSVVKLLDPDKPIFIAQNNYTRLQETAQGADIVATDPYPIPNVSLRSVSDAADLTVRSASGRKPAWIVLPQYETKIPTPAELRCMCYLAVAGGANGLALYAWDDRSGDGKGWYTRDHPEQVETLRTVFRELRGIEQVLLIPNADAKLSVAPENKALHAAVKQAGGKRFLILVNDSRRAEESVLAIDGVGDVEGRCLADGGAKTPVRIADGKLALKMPALGAAVYELVNP